MLLTGLTRTQKKFFYIGAAIVIWPLYRTATHPYWMSSRKIKDRTVVITGATGKYGKSLAYSMAFREARLVIGARDMEKCKLIRREIVYLTGNKSITCRHLDLEDVHSINKFADEVSKEEPHIDILINCAAVKNVKEKELTKYGVEKNYWVNYIAPYLLTFRLMPKLEESGAITLDSRILNVIGRVKKHHLRLDDINFDKRNYKADQAYWQSKLAFGYFTFLLEKYCRKQKNHVYVFGIDPYRWNMKEFNYVPMTLKEFLISVFDLYWTVPVERLTQTATRVAVDPSYAHPNHSGKLYAAVFSHWGWGGLVDKNETEAKLVWNSAAEKLVEV